MRIVRCLGGLGNQMFQYALYKSLNKRFGKVKMDLTGFNNYPLHNGFEVQNIFDLHIDIAPTFISRVYYTPERKWIFRKLRKIFNIKNMYYEETSPFNFNQELFSNEHTKYYWGYWQNPLYFADIEDEIRNDFKFKLPLDEKNQLLLIDIRKTNSVSLHIRRGDYIQDPLLGGLCNMEYYQKAIKHINESIKSPKYFIFSNDMEWCKTNFELPNCEFVSWNNGASSYIDMQLMSACKHNIIANSSFSWWGAWLNNNTLKIVIGPKKWTNNTQIDTSRLFPTNWISS
jgi:hypothetical protein